MLFMILDIVKKGEFAGRNSGDISTVSGGSNPTPSAGLGFL